MLNSGLIPRSPAKPINKNTTNHINDSLLISHFKPPIFRKCMPAIINCPTSNIPVDVSLNARSAQPLINA